MKAIDFTQGLDFIAAVHEAPSIVAIGDRFAAAAAAYGFTRFAYAALRRPAGAQQHLLYFTTYPEAWLARYRANAYHLSDPVVAAAARTVLPFAWEEVVDRQTGSAARRVMDEAREVGLVHGLTIPVHGADGEFGLVSLATDLPRKEFDRLLPAARHPLHLLALHCHEAARRQIAMGAPARPGLSERERECLQWTAQGKTAWEVAGILSLSERTVKFHLSNAMRKLGACSKTQAVARAMALRQIVA